MPCVTQSLNRVARNRVNHHFTATADSPRRSDMTRYHQGEQLHFFGLEVYGSRIPTIGNFPITTPIKRNCVYETTIMCPNRDPPE